MKTTLLIALILVSSVYSKQFEGQFVPHARRHERTKENLSEEDLSNLLNHNFGVLEQKVSDRSSQLIEKLGKGNLLNPVEMNYMFVIEGLSNESAQNTLIKESVPFTVELSDDKKNTLFNQIFDDENSIKSNMMKNFNSGKKAPFFLYSSQNAKSEHFRDHGVAMNKRSDNNRYELLDFGNENILFTENELKKCVNEVFKGAYVLHNNILTKKNVYHEELEVTQENEKELEDFFRDACSIYKISKMFKKGKQPNMAVFQLDTVSKLEKVMSTEEFKHVQSMLEVLFERTGNNFEKSFGEEKTFGQILFTDENQEQDTTPAEFSQMVEQDRVRKDEHRKRMLESGVGLNDSSNYWDPAAYSIVCWFWVVLAFVTFYAFGTAVNMNIQKDTILYAKFITAHDK